MARKGIPKELEKHKFKPGQSGNPEGGRLHDPVTKALKKLTVETYREVIEMVLTNDLLSLKKLAEDPKTPAIQVGVATTFMKAIQRGDYDVIERIAERIVGKIPEEINVRSQNLNANLNARIDKTELRAALKEIEEDV